VGGFPSDRKSGEHRPRLSRRASARHRVAESKRAKNRVHIDLVDPDPAAIEAMVTWGAAVVGRHELSDGHAWTVMQDPEGNEFCVASKPFTGWA
jgi:hypothetical protein